MINKAVLSSVLHDKFSLLALHSIVNECFINGLPLKQEDISNDEKVALTKYSYKVLEQVGGFRALENALGSAIYNDKQKTFLFDIYETCKEIANEATKRVVMETNCKDPETKFEEVVDKAAFTDAEFAKFSKNADKLNLEDASEIIKKKVLTVLKDEKEQYEKEEELHNELKDALKDSEDFSETSTESYMDIVLTKADPRHHVSLFSKLQEAAFEVANTTKVIDGEDVFPIIDRVTFEAFLSSLRKNDVDVDICYEAYVENNDERLAEIPADKKAKIASLVSMIVYTIMETLKTMNVHCPSQDEVKKFVCDTSDNQKMEEDKVSNIYAKAMEMLKEANCSDFTKMDSTKLSEILAELKKISDTLKALIINDMNSAVASKITITLDGLREQQNRIESILNERTRMEEERATESAITAESYYGKLQRENDIAQFNKITNLFAKNPLVKEIRLRVDPKNARSVVDIEAANEAGQVIRSSFMNMQVAVESSRYCDYLAETFKESKLADTDKHVCIVYSDGTGKRISLN